MTRKEKLFPSPLGDYVFNQRLLTEEYVKSSFRPLSGIMFSINTQDRFTRTIFQFPSPLGDYVFNLVALNDDELFINTVSVPSRGLCFQSMCIRLIRSLFETVSVPSRGLCFQSIMTGSYNETLSTFPSPLGDYVFNQGDLNHDD